MSNKKTSRKDLGILALYRSTWDLYRSNLKSILMIVLSIDLPLTLISYFGALFFHGKSGLLFSLTNWSFSLVLSVLYLLSTICVILLTDKVYHSRAGFFRALETMYPGIPSLSEKHGLDVFSVLVGVWAGLSAFIDSRSNLGDLLPSVFTSRRHRKKNGN